MARKDNAWRRKYRTYSEYRYGAERPVTVAPIWSRDKRRSMISQAMDLMRDWRLSPFEFEGEAIAGMRSGLCVAGYGWQRSDAAARDVIAEALRMLDAKRPSWEQGQPDYVEPRDVCLWCKGPLETGTSGTGYKYCSAECARIALQRRDFEVRGSGDKRFAAAKLMLERANMKPIPCERCGKIFHPLPRRAQRFCSNFCSRHARPPAPECEFTCEFCGVTFLSRSEKARFCSGACKKSSSVVRKGGVLHRLSPHVLDSLFHRQGLRITHEKMAA